jgi:hypothetical protein
VRPVRLGRAYRDVEPARDLLVRVPERQQPADRLAGGAAEECQRAAFRRHKREFRKLQVSPAHVCRGQQRELVERERPRRSHRHGEDDSLGRARFDLAEQAPKRFDVGRAPAERNDRAHLHTSKHFARSCDRHGEDDSNLSSSSRRGSTENPQTASVSSPMRARAAASHDEGVNDTTTQEVLGA